jgi:superfamily II DNA or RNA helicase
MQKSRTAFSAGQHVSVRDERWVVLHADHFGATCVLTLRGLEYANRDDVLSVLAPLDVVTSIASSRRVRHRSRHGVLLTVATHLAEATAWTDCWTAATARIDLHGWQLEPARAAVTGTTRLLLADEVGLGKTIQAGLIVAELLARGLADRVLVLTPASLRNQWSEELDSRFGLSPVVFDHATVTAAAASLPADVNPWTTSPLIISSIDLVKRPEVRAALDGVAFDILVIDEAHHVTPGTDRGALIADLAARVAWVVLITATPHSGDDSAYNYLTSLGDIDNSPLRLFRRARPPGSRARRSRMLMVAPTLAERSLLEATAAYARTLSRRGAPGARLVASVIARRASSSSLALADTLTRRAALLAELSLPERQPLLPWEDDDGNADDVPDSVLAAPGFADVTEELSWLRRLQQLAHAASDKSSKVLILRRLLRRTGEQVLVFSEYRDVAMHVAHAIDDLTTIAVLHGALSARERQKTVDAFNTGGARVLIATDAAGEGLNLHARCRLVVNLELPWTPLRLEQRIGRVDRIGQRRRVHAVQLAHRDSFEGTVIARLERRRACAARMAPAVPAGTTAEDHAAAEDRVVLRRALSRVVGKRAAGRGGVYASRPVRWQPPEAVDRQDTRCSAVLLYETAFQTASGFVVARHLTALNVSMRSGRRLRRRDVRALLSASNVRHLLFQELQAQRQVVAAQLDLAGRLIARRYASLLTGLQQPSRAAWQGSLFDRRQEQAAHRNQVNVRLLRDHIERRQLAAIELQHVRIGEPQFVAASRRGG